MAPNGRVAPNEIINLVSDDDSAGSRTPTRPSGQLTISSSNRKSAAKRASTTTRPAKTPANAASSERVGNGRLEFVELSSPDRENRQQNSRPQKTSGAGISSAVHQKPSKSRPMPRESPREVNGTSSDPANSSQALLLYDSEETRRVRTKQFRMPSALAQESSRTPSDTGDRMLSPRVQSHKRPREMESSLSSSQPSKKPKLQHHNSERNLSSQSTPHNLPTPSDSTSGSRKEHPKPKTKVTSSPHIDLTSPPPGERPEPKSLERESRDRETSSEQSRKVKATPQPKSSLGSEAGRTGGNLTASSASLKQRDQIRPTQWATKSACFGPGLNGRIHRNEANEEAPDANVGISSSPTVKISLPSNSDARKSDTERRSKDRSPALDVPSEVRTPARKRTPVPKSPSKASQTEWQLNKGTENAKGSPLKNQVETSNDISGPQIESEKASTSRKSTPKPVEKAAERRSSEEDQGYASLSSAAANNSKDKITKRLEARSPARDIRTRSSASPAPAINIAQNISEILRESQGDDQETDAGELPGEDPELGRKEGPAEAAASLKSKSRSASPKTPARRKNLAHNIPSPSPLSKSTKVFSHRNSPIDEEPSEGRPDLAETRGIHPSAKISMEQAATEAEEADLQLRLEAMAGIEESTEEAELVDDKAAPESSVSALQAPVYSNLPLASQVEKVLGKYLEELRGDNEYWTSVEMNRARLSKETVLQPKGRASFKKLKPLVFSTLQKGSAESKSDKVWNVERMTPSGKGFGITRMSANYEGISTDRADVPNYAHYVSIKNNILAPNVINLYAWPYFGDEFDMHEARNLEDLYNVDIAERERKLLLLIQAQKYEEYVESALADLGCSWADVLRFLLEPHPDVGADLNAKEARNRRDQFCREDFSRASDRWTAVLEALPPSTPEKVGFAAVLCDNFQKLAKFSLWHVARRSDFAKPAEKERAAKELSPSDNDMTCRICLRFNCPYHGEFDEEDPSSENESESGSGSGSVPSMVDSVVAKDIIHPMKANFRSRIAFHPPSENKPDASEAPQFRKEKKELRYWQTPNFQHKADERGPFYPCHHPGVTCSDAKCSCYLNKVPCEKICDCAPDCTRKFQGCLCAMNKIRKGQAIVCFEDERCVCYQLGRECDPDLCGTCGVCDVVDPVNKYDDDILKGRCRNASIQRAVPKHTVLGDSGVHGLGLYACEDIRVNDFVGEYKGEIITKEEADRRGAVYEHQKLSYLFSLNATQEIDSTYFGNKVRFINHAYGGKANLYPRIIMVNTVHRIALYAEQHITAGQELLFDYGPKFPNEQLGGKKSKKSAPHVRNANLVKGFLDVEESEDEVGNLRAKAVSKSSGPRNKAKARAPRGGARPGAGRKPSGPKPIFRDESPDELSEDPDVENGDNGNEVYDKTQDAGERLQAFNISDDVPSDAMDVVDDDEPFEPDGSVDSDGSDDSEHYGEDEDDDEEEDSDEEIEGVKTRGYRRRK